MSRRVELNVKYQGVDISKDIAKYLLNFSYTDNATNEADDLDITLEDSEGLWHGDWLPEKGDLIHASFNVKNWGEGEQALLCGTFTIDEINLDGPPDIVSLKGQSVPIVSSIKYTKKTKSWKNVNLSQIAKDIAKVCGLKLMFECSEDPKYESVDQVKQSDMSFLQKLCTREGISLKVTDNQMVLFEQKLYEQSEVVETYIKGKSNILSYGFNTSSNDTSYGSCRVRYTNPTTNKVIEYTTTVGEGPQLEINEQVKSIDEAKRVSSQRLREKNMKEYQANLSVLGNVNLASGVTIELKGWHKFDGKYIIQKATHKVTGGYTTDLELTKCLEGY